MSIQMLKKRSNYSHLRSLQSCSSLGLSHQTPELWCGYGFPLRAMKPFIPLQRLSHLHHLHVAPAAGQLLQKSNGQARAVASHAGPTKPQCQRYVFHVGRWFLSTLPSTPRTSSSILLGGLIKDSVSSISSSGIFYLGYYHNYFATCNEISGDSICWNHM